MRDLRHSASTKPFPHTTKLKTGATCGRSLEKEGRKDGRKEQLDGGDYCHDQTCDGNVQSWTRNLCIFFFNITALHFFPSGQIIVILPHVFVFFFLKEKERKKKKGKRNQHRPRRLPPVCRIRHASSRARHPFFRHCALSVRVSTGPACQWWPRWRRRGRTAPGRGCSGPLLSWASSPRWRRAGRPWRSPFASAVRRPPEERVGGGERLEQLSLLNDTCEIASLATPLLPCRRTEKLRGRWNSR